VFDSVPSYVVNATLNLGWNTIDLGVTGWDMTTSFLIGYTFSDEISAGLEGSGTSDNSYSRIGGGWVFWGDDATQFGLPHGDFGVRANITYNSPNVTYNVYNGVNLALSSIDENSVTVSGLENNSTYAFHLTANFDCGESEPSESVEITPQPQTTVEVSYDDGSAEEFFNAGSGNFTAVEFNVGAADLVRFKWLQEGDGGAFYIKVYENNGGMPGAETYSQIVSTLVQGWNTFDLLTEGLTVSGTFWIGTKGFTSTESLVPEPSRPAEISSENVYPIKKLVVISHPVTPRSIVFHPRFKVALTT
jgi:hypothetical protein